VRSARLACATLTAAAVATVGTAALAGGHASGAARCPTFHTYLGNYPKERQVAWAEEAQGLAHDGANWYVTQRDALWRFPVGFDLNSSISGTDETRGVLRVPIPSITVAIRGLRISYNHIGDLDYARGFLFLPLEGSKKIGSTTIKLPPAIAVYRAPNLQFVGFTQIPQQQSAGWVAIGRPNPLLWSSNRATSAPGRNDGGPIFRYRIDWAALAQNRVSLTFVDRFPLRDEAGATVFLDYMQGGTFTARGCLYIVNGFDEDFDPADGGISVFDSVTGRRVARSTNGSGPFNYEFHPGFSTYEEPEGITFWDLDGRGAPGISGELHVLMLDNDSNGDDVYIKHYALR
jgi:hypothetical protein